MLFHKRDIKKKYNKEARQDRHDAIKGRCLALFMLVVMLFGGCGIQHSADAPKLLEPVAGNRFYRPVTKRVVGEQKQLYATVVPKEYAQFFSVAGTVTEVYVSAGDYVRKGDKLAELDLSELKQQYETLKEELAYEEKYYCQQEKVFRVKERMIKEAPAMVDKTAKKEEAAVVKEQAASGEGQEISSEKEKRNLLLKQQEEERYQKEQYEKERGQKQEQLRKMERVLKDGTLLATKNGYVGYVKDLSKSSELKLYETVVLLCDAKKTCLTVREHTMKEEAYSACEAVYIKGRQGRTSLTPVAYSKRELSYMEAVKSYPPLCYELPEDTDLTVGEQVVVYYETKKQEETLCVGLDSLYEEGQDTYVYVRTGEKDSDAEEKRKVTLGERDAYYVQVIAGVTEGEWVRYENLSLQPDKQSAKTIALSDYTTRLSSERCSWVSTKLQTVQAKEEFVVDEIYIKKGDKVRAGTPLFSVKQVGGKADIAALNIQIRRQKQSISDAEKEYRRQKLEQDAQGSKEPLSYQLLREEYTLNIMEQRWQLARLLEELALLRRKNDGSGKKIYCAEKAGTLSNWYITEGERYQEGANLYTLEMNAKKLLKVELTNAKEALSFNNTAKLFSKVELSIKDGTKEGNCVFNYMQGTTHICTRDKELVESRVEQEEERCFYVDAGFDGKETLPAVTKAAYTGKQIKQVVLLSSIYIHQEDNLSTGETAYFVWKQIDGVPVKEYITLDEGMLTGDAVIIYTGLWENDLVM